MIAAAYSDESLVSPSPPIHPTIQADIDSEYGFEQGEALFGEAEDYLITVPEPHTLLGLASGLGLLALLERRRRASRRPRTYSEKRKER